MTSTQNNFLLKVLERGVVSVQMETAMACLDFTNKISENVIKKHNIEKETNPILYCGFQNNFYSLCNSDKIDFFLIKVEIGIDIICVRTNINIITIQALLKDTQKLVFKDNDIPYVRTMPITIPNMIPIKLNINEFI